MDPEHARFLAVAFVTHGVVGYALVRTFTETNPLVGFVLAPVPDVDLLLSAVWGGPFVHRGVTHSPAFVLVAVSATLLYPRTRPAAPAVALALGSHVVIDSLSPVGVPWLFPFGGRVTPGIDVHGPVPTLLLWAFAAALVAWDEWGRRPDRDRPG